MEVTADAVLEGHTGTVTSVAFAPDGAFLATTSGDWDKTVRLWDVDRRTLLHRLGPLEDWVTACAFTPDGDTVVAWCGAWTSAAWRVASGRPRGPWWRARHRDALRRHPHRGQAVSPDGRFAVVTAGGLDGGAAVVDPRDGSVQRVLEGHVGWVHACAVSPVGDMVATASGDGTAALWDPATGRLVRRLVGHEGWVTGCAFRPSGGLLATSGSDGTVRLWRV